VNTPEIFACFETILVCELNLGQFARYLCGAFPRFHYEQYNKVEGLPFTVAGLKEKIVEILTR
jgi:2-oxoglutarate ferredoxin oxidoreductase subunit alpha